MTPKNNDPPLRPFRPQGRILSLFSPGLQDIRISHNLIRLLKEADLQAGTEYYETLWQFLRWERSFLETAREMGVHRNTIVYRLDRIQQMYPLLDLDDPDERQYLMFSYWIDRKTARIR